MPDLPSSVKLTCDVGGTFSDVVAADSSGRVVLGKSPSTPPDLLSGLLDAIADAAGAFGATAPELLSVCDLFVYSTTQATNAILEGKTARTALLLTSGFPDTLIRREGGTLAPYDLQEKVPQPYVPRHLTFEVVERMTAEGDVLVPLDEDAVRTLLHTLVTIEVEAIAVSLLWSTANGAHESRVGELIREICPHIPYTLSHELNPIIREYRRTSGTAIDASLKKLMPGHLSEIETGLRELGFTGELLAATSVGGAMPMKDLIERPIYAAKSGPSLAPIAGRLFTHELDNSDLIVCDTGGTSFDISLIRDGQIVTTRDTWLGGTLTGHLTGLSSVDVQSIGAGGGSIAWVDSGGLLRVGPESASSFPGPACYGHGGVRPTVTDAALVLGYLDPERFLGGRMSLDVAAAQRAIDQLAETLGTTRLHMASGVLTVANEHMVNAIREITMNQGIDPRRSALVAGGGAAGLSIAAIAADLGVGKVLVPRAAGALSAYGGQYSDIVIEQGRSIYCNTKNFDGNELASALDQIERSLEPFAAALSRRGVKEQRFEWEVEARYNHQVWSLTLPLNGRRFVSHDDVELLEKSFHGLHERVFAVSDPDQAVELMHCQGRLVATPYKPPRTSSPGSGSPAGARRTQSAYFPRHGEVEATVVEGAQCSPGDLIAGPALVVEPTTTVVVPPQWRVTITKTGDYLMEMS
jgi:N-methylhydantoinase A